MNISYGIDLAIPAPASGGGGGGGGSYTFPVIAAFDENSYAVDVSGDLVSMTNQVSGGGVYTATSTYTVNAADAHFGGKTSFLAAKLQNMAGTTLTLTSGSATLLVVLYSNANSQHYYWAYGASNPNVAPNIYMHAFNKAAAIWPFSGGTSLQYLSANNSIPDAPSEAQVLVIRLAQGGPIDVFLDGVNVENQSLVGGDATGLAFNNFLGYSGAGAGYKFTRLLLFDASLSNADINTYANQACSDYGIGVTWSLA